MARQYDIEFVNKLKERQIIEYFKGQEVIIKRLPDCDEDGAMDPRLYESSKKMMKQLRLVPNFLLKKMMKIDPDNLTGMREMFNGIKSVPTVSSDIHIVKHQVQTDPGTFIDLYQYTNKKTTKESPVLYYIHGGGFFGGHHGVVEESLKLMVEKYNFTIFSVDYRLAPENPYPAGHHDVFATLKWIYNHADELNIDRKKITVAGDSAGGNLTQYCSTKDREEGSNIVKAQMLLYPTVNMCGIEDEFFHWDLSYYHMIPSQKKALTKMIGMFGGMTDGIEPLLKCTKEDTMSPYLNPYTRTDIQNDPPTFVTAGEHDYLKVETLAWAAKLHHAGVKTKAVIYNGLGHAYFDNCGVFPQTEDCIDEMAQFIIENTK